MPTYRLTGKGWEAGELELAVRDASLLESHRLLYQINIKSEENGDVIISGADAAYEDLMMLMARMCQYEGVLFYNEIDGRSLNIAQNVKQYASEKLGIGEDEPELPQATTATAAATATVAAANIQVVSVQKTLAAKPASSTTPPPPPPRPDQTSDADEAEFQKEYTQHLESIAQAYNQKQQDANLRCCRHEIPAHSTMHLI